MGDVVYMIRIPQWHPARASELEACQWAKRSRIRREDRETVADHARDVRVPAAEGRRQVGVTLILRPSQSGGEPDEYRRPVIEALVRTRLLVDGSRDYAEMSAVSYTRGTSEDWGTIITLRDIA